MRYLIVGAGPAGVVAAETLRAQDPDAEVVIYGSEPEPAYSRMAIPYLLTGKIEEQGTYLRHNPDHFEHLGIRLVQAKVAAVDTNGKNVTLADGSVQTYDRLLLASGSRPVRPPIEGLDHPGIYHCWTLEDARRIAQYAQPGARVALLGAGFIGSIIMEALMERQVRLSVVEMADRMVPRMMDSTAGGLIKRWCVLQGVDVHTSTRVTRVDEVGGENPMFRLECDPADPVEADLVVVATGVRPSLEYLSGSGIAVADGILVDEYQETSVPGVFAAGDACEGFDWNSRHRALHAIQPAAVETGRMAALNMAGGRVPHAGSLGMNVLDSLGLISTSYGAWDGVPGGDSAQILDAGRFRYIKLQFAGDRLVGAITLGVTEHVGALRGLIQSKASLGVWKERLRENPSRFMEAYLAAMANQPEFA